MGDPKATLQKLIAAVGRPSHDSAYADRAAGIVAAWRETMAPLFASGEAPIPVERLCAGSPARCPTASWWPTPATRASGPARCIEMNGVGQQYLRAAGSLGWSFPASLGAKCAAGGRKVVCFTGDGALYYHLPELETARRRGIAVVSGGQQQFRLWPELAKCPPPAGRPGGDPRELVLFGPTNFSDVARDFGLRGIRVEQPDGIAPALRDALASDETVVVDVATAPGAARAGALDAAGLKERRDDPLRSHGKDRARHRWRLRHRPRHRHHARRLRLHRGGEPSARRSARAGGRGEAQRRAARRRSPHPAMSGSPATPNAWWVPRWKNSAGWTSW